MRLFIGHELAVLRVEKNLTNPETGERARPSLRGNTASRGLTLERMFALSFIDLARNPRDIFLYVFGASHKILFKGVVDFCFLLVDLDFLVCIYRFESNEIIDR